MAVAGVTAQAAGTCRGHTGSLAIRGPTGPAGAEENLSCEEDNQYVLL